MIPQVAWAIGEAEIFHVFLLFSFVLFPLLFSFRPKLCVMLKNTSREIQGRFGVPGSGLTRLVVGPLSLTDRI